MINYKNKNKLIKLLIKINNKTKILYINTFKMAITYNLLKNVNIVMKQNIIYINLSIFNFQ